MALYTVYAEASDLAEYLGVAEATLPDDTNRLLTRASELMKQVTNGNIIVTNSDHMEALKLAVCAQVENWNSIGEDSAIGGNVQSFSLGELSMNFAAAGINNILSTRARAYLNEQGLLYRGVSFGNKVVGDK